MNLHLCFLTADLFYSCLQIAYFFIIFSMPGVFGSCACLSCETDSPFSQLSIRVQSQLRKKTFKVPPCATTAVFFRETAVLLLHYFQKLDTGCRVDQHEPYCPVHPLVLQHSAGCHENLIQSPKAPTFILICSHLEE